VQPLWKAVCRSFRKLKIELPYDPAMPLLGIYLKECAPRYDGVTYTPMLIAVLFIIAMLWKQPRCPTTDEWTKKMLAGLWCLTPVVLATQEAEIRIAV
jgi:hypothetical protein